MLTRDCLDAPMVELPKEGPYSRKDLFYLLTNYRRRQEYDQNLLHEKNLFFLYAVKKIPFDYNVLKLLPDKLKYGRYIECIRVWDEYLKNGKIVGDISNLFKDGKSIVLSVFFKYYKFEDLSNTRVMVNADAIDVITWVMHPEHWNRYMLVTSGFPLPGMLSYEIMRHRDLPFHDYPKEVEMVDFYVQFSSNDVVCVNSKGYTLEEVKIMDPQPLVIVIDANPYGLTEYALEQTYKLAYVLCRKKLIIVKDKRRIEWIKKILKVNDIVVPSTASGNSNNSRPTPSPPTSTGNQRF